MHRAFFVGLALCSTAAAQSTFRVAQLDITGFVHTFGPNNASSAFEPGGIAGCDDTFGVLQVAEPNAGANLAVISGSFQPLAGDTLEFAVAAPVGAVVRVNRPCDLQVEIQQVLLDCCQSSIEPVRAYVLRNGLLVQPPLDLTIAPSSFLTINEFVTLPLEPCAFDQIVFRLEDISGYGTPITAEVPSFPPPFAGTFDAFGGDFSGATCADIPVRTAEVINLNSPIPGVHRLREVEIAGFSHLFDSGVASSEFGEDMPGGDCDAQPGFLQKTDSSAGVCDGFIDGPFLVAQGDRIEFAIAAPQGRAIRLNRPATLDYFADTILDGCCLNSPENIIAVALRDGIVVAGPIDTNTPAQNLLNGFGQVAVDLPACSFDTVVFRIDNVDGQPAPLEVLPPMTSQFVGVFAAFGDFSDADCATATTAELIDCDAPAPTETADATGNGVVDIEDLLTFLALWFSGV